MLVPAPRYLLLATLAAAMTVGVCRAQTTPLPDAPAAQADAKRSDGKPVDRCRQSGSMAARLANYRLQGMALADLIAEIRETGVEEAATPKVEKMATEVYTQALLPAQAFQIYQKSCPFRD